MQSEFGKLLEMSKICEAKNVINQESLERFDALMGDSHQSEQFILENKIRLFNGKFENKEYGEMGNSCIIILEEMSDYFCDKKWDEITSDDRAKVLSVLVNKVCEACEIDIKGIKYFKVPPYWNGYVNGDGYLYLNQKYLIDSKLKEDALSTFFHEARHAYQRAVVSAPYLYCEDIKTVKTWKNNFDNYLSAEKFGYYRYFNQPVEVDANKFAEYVLKNKGF